MQVILKFLDISAGGGLGSVVGVIQVTWYPSGQWSTERLDPFVIKPRPMTFTERQMCRSMFPISVCPAANTIPVCGLRQYEIDLKNKTDQIL
jgi:hypothetical protein